MKVITLGTAGGPRWWRGDARDRAGIATAIVVGDRHYLVDAGHGVGRRLRQAGLDLGDLGGVFITHLHSDHTIDLPSLVVFGMHELQDRVDDPVAFIGPGDRGALPPVSPRALVDPHPVVPSAPTPGITGMFDGIVRAFATDINDRVLDSLRTSPEALFAPRDIAIPDTAGYHPNAAAHPLIDPFLVFEDDRVSVTATLVDHPPVAPAFAFRFDSEWGSVTVSGDTAESDNLIRLARDTDVLLHEAIDFDWVAGMYDDRPDEEAQASRDHHFKSHTSVEGAIRVAAQAGARTLALHHLVPGSADDSVWARGRELFAGTFLVPEDLDEIAVTAPAAAVAAAARG